MANRFQKFIYFLSAETPALVIFAIVWIIKKSTWNKPIQISWKVPIWLIVISIMLIILFFVFFNKAKKNLSILDIKGTDFHLADERIVAYVITYLLPMASFPFSDFIVSVLIIVLFILIIVFTFTDYVAPHPLLFCLGYHFYELSVEGAASGFIVVSKKRIRNINDFQKVSRVFEFLLIRVR